MSQYSLMAKILVTGFEPFSSHSRNISGDLLEILEQRQTISDPWKDTREYELKEINIFLETELLSVDQKGSTRISQKLSQGSHWDAIIHIGLCSSCDIPKIELLAKNILDMTVEDNSGRRLTGYKIGDSDYPSTINSNLILTNQGSLNAEISYDAGSFICNETYYHTLSKINQIEFNNARTPCVFLHLPDYDRYSLKLARELLENIIGRVLFKPVISVAAGVIIDDNKILVAKRSDDRNMGLWEFPGGKFEWGEKPHQAIERELKEEFNWNVKGVKSFGNWFHQGDDFDIDLNVQKCQFIGETPDFEDQNKWTSHDEVQFISDADEVYPYIGLDKSVAKKVFKELSNPSGRLS